MKPDNDININFKTLQSVLDDATAIIFDDTVIYPSVDSDNGTITLDQREFTQDDCLNIVLQTRFLSLDRDIIRFEDGQHEPFYVETLEPAGSNKASMREQIALLQRDPHEPVVILDENTIMWGDEIIAIPEDLDLEEMGYRIEEKSDFIGTLCQWISEASSSDRTMMLNDLELIIGKDDDYFFSSTSTNAFLFPSDQGSSLKKGEAEIESFVVELKKSIDALENTKPTA